MAAELTGDVVRPDDPRYEQARQGWNQLYQRYPQAIVYCQQAADVVNAVAWARATGTAFRARSGGHSLEGWSVVDDGLVIDVGPMKRIEIDTAAGTATVGTGLLQKEAVAELGARGYVIPTGSEGGVGLGGVVLGGGFGLLTRRWGLASDHLIAADLVIAEGSRGAELVHVSEHEHPDLLWACRGGGGNNLGIATSYTFELATLADVTFVFATWAGRGDLAEILGRWQHEAPVADERLSSALEINSEGAALSAVLYGGTAAEATDALRNLLAIGTPEVTVTEDSWPTVYADVDKAPVDVVNWKFHSQFVKQPFPGQAIQLICDYLDRAPSPASNYFLSSFGGAVRHEPRGGSVFPHRDALFYCEPGAGWNGSELTAAASGWVTDFANALRPYVDGGYVNVPNAGAADWQTQYYGANAPRLREIKAAYDPDDVFTFEQSIPTS